MATVGKHQGTLAGSSSLARHEARCKSSDTKLEAQVDRFGAAPDTRILESTTLRAFLERYFY